MVDRFLCFSAAGLSPARRYATALVLADVQRARRHALDDLLSPVDARIRHSHSQSAPRGRLSAAAHPADLVLPVVRPETARESPPEAARNPFTAPFPRARSGA